MKKFISNTALIAFLFLAPLMSDQLQAQPPTPPATGNQPGNQQMGGNSNAPIESGLAILLTLAASYGFRKATVRKKDAEIS
jgi:hypothetical protein